MPSPFPGMDPYLEDESLWPSFHDLLISNMQQILMPNVADRYRIRTAERRYVVSRMPAGSDVEAERCEEFLEIRDRASDRLVTILDVVSPVNKTTAAGREAYLATRRKAKEARASLVEVDLVRQGQPTLQYSRDGLPVWDYAVTVTRSAKPETYEIYTATLQKRLPKFRLPLAADDRDAVLDLGAAFGRCYEFGRYAERIDYGSEPTVPLSEEVRRWRDELLQARKLRNTPDAAKEGGAAVSGKHPSHEEIASVAYGLWQAQGCPHGHDQEHWYRAIELLKRTR